MIRESQIAIAEVSADQKLAEAFMKIEELEQEKAQENINNSQRVSNDDISIL